MTEAELLAALEDATRRSPGGEGATVAELRAATGMSDHRVRDILRAGLARGRVARCRRVIETLSGGLTTVPSYRFVDDQAA